jgi:hypothetical protein
MRPVARAPPSDSVQQAEHPSRPSPPARAGLSALAEAPRRRLTWTDDATMRARRGASACAMRRDRPRARATTFGTLRFDTVSATPESRRQIGDFRTNV